MSEYYVFSKRDVRAGWMDKCMGIIYMTTFFS